ncbi:uncharacterized protein BDCG_00249 [Blastomyces dermatitidis ER-3]|uniref:Uncharacterized protein n=1 Tax=Ajellomyces dermatitidis (strain ER-3 / ATCC MYA-2586) TaxID=559297 RepID=A0ABP2EK12_AJEDR|nr:uncharacterized protein BDCG_00249 [Blastomyces dermatitidis ER-3]EEQ83444.2 hypothetical protein BDCG_00249 [Blastomyces dermatitidis ER-3]
MRAQGLQSAGEQHGLVSHAETVSALLGSALLFFRSCPASGGDTQPRSQRAVSLESFEESEFTQYTHFIGALLLRGHDRRQVTEYFGYDPLLAGQNVRNILHHMQYPTRIPSDASLSSRGGRDLHPPPPLLPPLLSPRIRRPVGRCAVLPSRDLTGLQEWVPLCRKRQNVEMENEFVKLDTVDSPTRAALALALGYFAK